MRVFVGTSVLAVAASLVGRVYGKAVFAHYMVGTVTEEHAHQDIDDAIAMGLDGFALNVGNPYEPFVTATLGYLFGYAAYRGFQLYLSMDVYASGDACYHGAASCNGPFDYADILRGYLGNSAWYHGPNGFPMVSTFSSGGKTNDTWIEWKADWANQIYFVPDFDETTGYYESADGWWFYWGDIVDGIFSWESAWPSRAGFGGSYPGDIGPDIPVLYGAIAHGKSYMMGLSLCQYKNAYGTNIYREGGLNLPQRIANILSMNPQPDFVQIQTWNDGPESHYIGNLWPEQNTDPQPNAYATQTIAPHNGLRPLITSFINAYKSGGSQGSMAPSSGTAAGAMWYKPILQGVSCPSDGTDYTRAPDGFGTASDSITWAVVLPADASGMQIRITSNGNMLTNSAVGPGLNFGQIPGLSAGSQLMELLDAGGSGILVAGGGRCVSSDCIDGIYNMNPLVLGLGTDDGSGYPCITGSEDEIFRKSLSSSSTCADLEGGILNSDYWDSTDATNKLKAWESSYTDANFIFDFGTPLGNGQSISSCRVASTSSCIRPDCTSLENYQNAPGSGWKYCVEVSIVNFKMYLNAVFGALIMSNIQFATLQAVLQQTFWPSESASQVKLQQILNGIATGVGVVAALADKPLGSALAELVKGIINGVSISLTQLDETIANLASAETIAQKWVSQGLSELINVDGNTTSYGFYENTHFSDLFDHGAWLDYRNIAVLNTDRRKAMITASQLNDTFWTHLVAGLVNTAWIKQKTFLMSYPMSESDFNSRIAASGDNDFRLKHYFNGRGYYFQSLYPDHSSFSEPHTQNPPGWGDVEQYGFSTWDIIESSAGAYDARGFSFPNADVINSIVTAGDRSTLLASTKTPGVFTIPICHFSTSDASIDEFFSYLRSLGATGPNTVVCYIIPLLDQNGKSITSVIDFEDWYGRYCGDITIPGS